MFGVLNLEQKMNTFSFNPLIFTPLLCFTIFFLLKWFSSSKPTNKNLPPSPPKLPIIGNLHQLGSYPHRSLQSLAQCYGSFMSLRLGRVQTLIVSSADAACEIMKTHDLSFSNRPRSSIGEKLLYNCKDVASAPYGEYWRQIRSICVLHLLSTKRVQSFHSVREEEIVIMMKKIEGSLNMGLDLSEMFATLTNDVVCRVALGRKYGDGSKFKLLLSEFTGLLGGFDVGDFVAWFGWLNWVSGVDAKAARVAKDFDDFLEGVINEHMEVSVDEGNKKQDLVDVLLEVQKSDSTGFRLENISIKAIILDMFAAGIDTTYTVLEWAMTELLLHPQVMNKLQLEVRQITASQSHVKEDDLHKMLYLKSVIKETFRLHPPIPLLVGRQSIHDVKVNGYDIAAETLVITNAWTIGRDPASWDDPEEFRPERFLSSDVDFKGHHFQLIPFGAGPRGCPGTQFAMALDELVLANMVYKFEWSLPSGMRREDLDMSECTGLTIHRKVPLLVVPTLCSC